MRRRLHIAVALVTFACGFVVSGAWGRLPYVLWAGLVAVLLSTLAPRLRRVSCDAHRLKVAALTLLFWLVPLTLFFAVLGGPGNSCASLTFEEAYTPVIDDENEPPPAPEPPAGEESGEVCSPGSSPSVNAYSNLLWAGVIDGKAVSKPRPFYPPDARAERVTGTVAVWVVVDHAGRVLRARPIAGHPLLLREAARAACFARFHPTVIDAPPFRVSGVLTYRFAP